MIEELIKKYPRLFPKDENGNPAPPECLSDVPKGWEGLVDLLCKSLENYLFYKDVPFVVAQIKSKFGTLRFYADGGDDETRRMISVAEEESARICENTGQAGRARSRNGWVATLSDEEAKRLNFPDAK